MGLGRLWDTHPTDAFVFHLAITVMLGGFALSFILSGHNWIAALITGVGFLAMTATLVFFSWLAIQDHWQRSDDL
jgi:hypothetical protein